MTTKINQYDELMDALNHLDQLADQGSDYEEKSDQEKSYTFVANFIKQHATK